MAECDMGLYLDTARVIDAIDQEITDANERKKEIYADVKEQISAGDFRALKEAIKLRRKRRADKDACERHDERVWAILNVLEAPELPQEAETPPAATASPANGVVVEMAPTRAGAHAHEEEELPPHDPETGELIEPEADAGHGEILRATEMHEFEGIPDLPAALDRRHKMLEAAA